MSEKKNILIAPLDWGLGHATRCIPIIQQLRKHHSVFIATSGNAAILLKNEFPDLKHFHLASYNITYPINRSMTFHMALQFPAIWAAIIREKKITRSIIEKNKIDLIISDNRYGAYSKNIPSVFITHQINIKSPHLNSWINKLNQRAIKNFTECWIPDFEKELGMAGELSHPPPKNINSVYIGNLSRFTKSKIEKKYDITVVLSGPEPQRTILEDLLFEELFKFDNLKIKFVRGIYSENENSFVKNIEVHDHLPTTELEQILHESKNIICRSGYSSIMDLQNVQNVNFLFIPTPQQTEQEYLAKLHSQNENCIFQKQNELNLSALLNKRESFVNKTEAFPETDFNILIQKWI